MPHLSIRHQSRMIVLQSLYEWDFDEEKNIEEILERNIKTSGFKVDKEFCYKIIRGIQKKLKDIDSLIKKTAPEWPLEQIAKIDRAILRIGIFELLFDEEVPPKAVINEAVELGKEFGGENSGKFINGVLGTIYRSSDKYQPEEIEINAGAIIFREDQEKELFLLVKDKNDKWDFLQTKIQEEETWQEAIVRKIKKETNIEEAKVISEIGEIKLTDKNTEPPIKKNICFYLIKTEQKEIKLKEGSSFKELEWMEEKKVLKNLEKENLKNIFKKALQNIKEN